MDPIKKALNFFLDDVEFVNMDLNNQEMIDKALIGADFVIHTASPVGKKLTD